jgi:heptosyltransferase-1
MPRILLIKMSSLGDVVHNLPVATDIRRHRPDTIIDWVVEEQYVPLVRMHPAVDHVHPVSLRRWRRNVFSGAHWREFGEFRRRLTAQAYEAIIDTQGLLKSALVSKLAHGPVYGFGPATAREPLASRFYDVRLEFPPAAHKILRYRSVAARALGYAVPDAIDYGIRPASARPAFANGRYCVAFHATARAAKLWPEARWMELIRRLDAAGVACILPWGSGDERSRSERLAAAGSRCVVPPPMSIDEMAALIGDAQFVVGVDTGFMHLAAALVKPVVGIFCDSNPVDACPVGPGPTAYRGHVGQPPAVDDVVDALREVAPGSL